MIFLFLGRVQDVVKTGGVQYVDSRNVEKNADRNIVDILPI